MSAWDIENLELIAACEESASDDFAAANSDIRSLDNIPTHTTNSSYESVNVYPNPFSENVFFEVDSEIEDKVKIEIFDLNGRLISNYENKLAIGKNVLKINDLNTTSVSSVLIARVSIGNTVHTKRIVKM